MKFSIMTLSIPVLCVVIHHAECRYYLYVMLSVVILSVALLNVAASLRRIKRRKNAKRFASSKKFYSFDASNASERRRPRPSVAGGKVCRRACRRRGSQRRRRKGRKESGTKSLFLRLAATEYSHLAVFTQVMWG